MLVAVVLAHRDLLDHATCPGRSLASRKLWRLISRDCESSQTDVKRRHAARRWNLKRKIPALSHRDRALAALKASDRKIARLIDATEPIDLKVWRKAQAVDDPFGVLVYSIIGQQISGFAVRAIAGRLRERFAGRMPSPAELLAMDPTALKSVGLSRMKVEYLRSLAEHVISGELQIDHLDKLSDDQVREQITASRGLGRWTADMFLLINLQRPDILPIGDLGIRSAVQRLYRLDHLPSPREVDAIGEKWQPNRSLASFYLWASNRQRAKPASQPPNRRSKRTM